MKLSVILVAVIVLLAAVPLHAVIAKSRITAGEPTLLKDVWSLGDVIANASSKRVHIIYVHGMRAEGPGASEAFRARLTKSFGIEGSATKDTKALNLQPWPAGAVVGTTPIWDTVDDWKAGQPFIDRYVIKTRSAGVTVTIDEVNWWPLLFPLKCRMLIKPEARVAGLDRKHLDLCFKDEPPYHRWIDATDYRAAVAAKPALGGAAAGNKYLKQQILDWGMSDAVIATGPMRAYLNAAMDAAFDYASSDLASTEYVVISESLGSFVVLDAYARQKPAVRSVLNATHYLYFLANQFALLELARVEGIPAHVAHADGAEAARVTAPASAEIQVQQSPTAALQDWASTRPATESSGSRPTVKQIVAFSDPSDALTYRVPDFAGARVSNVYVRNAGSLLGLVANPIKAHSGHMQNSKVWDAMLRRQSTP